MGQATTSCKYSGQIINVEEAKKLRIEGGKNRPTARFLCIHCNQPVRPHAERSNGGVSAHFQHINLNPDCKPYQPRRSRSVRDNLNTDISEKSTSHVEEYSQTQVHLPEECRNDTQYFEGATRSVKVNAYERNSTARKACLRHHGYRCLACGLDFEQKYGAYAKGFIHVHHVVPLHSIGVSYQVDAVADLVPLCPNCHAAIHIGGVVRSVKQLQESMRARANHEA